MNSENPPIPESDNTNTEPASSIDKQQDEQSLDELEFEATPETFTDTWSDTDTDTVNVTSNDTKPEEIGENASELANSQTSELWLSEVPELSKSTPIEILPENGFADNLEIENSSNSSPEDSSSEPELFADRWLDESKADFPLVNLPHSENQAVAQDDYIVQLEQQKNDLHQEIEALKAEKEQMLLQQVKEVPGKYWTNGRRGNERITRAQNSSPNRN